MLTKQLKTSQQKAEKGSEIIAIYEQRCEHKKKLIALLDEELAMDMPEKNRLELEIKRLDIKESLIENEVSLKIKKEIQAEDLRARDRFLAEYTQLEKEINEGLFETGIEKIAAFVDITLKRDKKADVRSLNAILDKAEEDLNSEEKIDLYKQIRMVVGKLPQQKMAVSK